MPIVLRPMASQEMVSWMADHQRDYAASRVASGEPTLIAEANAVTSTARLFPGGAPAEGHDVFVLTETEDGSGDSGVAVGSLWIGPHPERADAMWARSIVVDLEYRGRGIGRAAMQLAEGEARRRGATEIGLNVFGFNEVAIGLYNSLGYVDASIQMRKVL